MKGGGRDGYGRTEQKVSTLIRVESRATKEIRTPSCLYCFGFVAIVDLALLEGRERGWAAASHDRPYVNSSNRFKYMSECPADPTKR